MQNLLLLILHFPLFFHEHFYVGVAGKGISVSMNMQSPFLEYK
jgi:hypothetical protein